MSCDKRYQKSTLNAYTNSAQTVVAEGVVNFNNNNPLTGCSVCHAAGSSTVQIVKPGLYLVTVNADAATTATAGGTITLQLFNNGILVPGATATETTTADTSIVSLAFSTIIRVLNSCSCVNNQTNLTVVNTGVEVTLSNANVVVVKLA